jgi:glycosyltransferase involved in cell wall biosynthesis
MDDYQKFTFHVVALPHSQTTKEYSVCAFNSKVRKFCDMMKSLGHTVYLYAGEENEAACDELITCMTKRELHDFVGVDGPEDILKAPFNSELPHWQVMNYRVVEAMRERIQPRDFICVIGGLCHKPVTDAFPGNMGVEFGIGYPGSYAKFRVFETYAWMHTVYGWQQTAAGANGNFYDRVIPSYFEVEDYPFSAKKDDYFLFVGRVTERKGYMVAVEAARALGTKLIMAGQLDPGMRPPDGVEYRGIVGPEERGELMSHARAGFVPTLYVEPFGSVAPETMMCGTPVLTTDWGAFPELVEQGVDGFRCRNLREFTEGAKACSDLDCTLIRMRAIERWSMDNVRWQYQDYFADLWTLWDKGWYTA